jgi:hypothetical protein
MAVTHGVLVLDDTDHQRVKSTTRIYGTHKVFDKKTGGYYNGQCLMFLLHEQVYVSGRGAILPP